MVPGRPWQAARSFPPLRAYHRCVDRSTADALRILDGVKRRPVPTGPVRLSRGYLRAVRLLEERPEHLSGSDKTWVENSIEAFRLHYACARRAR